MATSSCPVNFPLMLPSVPLLKSSQDLFLEQSLLGIYAYETSLPSFSNVNWVIKEISKRQRWVMRVPQELSNRLSCREEELEILRWAGEQGLTNLKVHAADPSKGYLLTPFLEGRACVAQDFQRDDLMRKGMELLQRLHGITSSPFSSEFDPFRRYEQTCLLSHELSCPLSDGIHTIVSTLREHFSQIPSCRWKRVPCHLDPAATNLFFVQEGELFLHDWELSSLWDPCWDLTHFSLLSDVQTERVLNFYSTEDPLARAKMTFFSPLVLLGTVLWAALEKFQNRSSIPLETVHQLHDDFLSKIFVLVESQEYLNAKRKLHIGDASCQ